MFSASEVAACGGPPATHTECLARAAPCAIAEADLAARRCSCGVGEARAACENVEEPGKAASMGATSGKAPGWPTIGEVAMELVCSSSRSLEPFDHPPSRRGVASARRLIGSDCRSSPIQPGTGSDRGRMSTFGARSSPTPKYRSSTGSRSQSLHQPNIRSATGRNIQVTLARDASSVCNRTC